MTKREQLEQYVYRHPWQFAAVEATAVVIIYALWGLPLIWAALIWVVAFTVVGWSTSRGPGRKSLERRIQRHKSS